MAKAPGDPGTTVGQIKTSMCSANVGHKGAPGTHSFSKATGNPSTSGGSSIKGPGQAGTGGSLTKAGSNAPGRW